jgi:integrase
MIIPLLWYFFQAVDATQREVMKKDIDSRTDALGLDMEGVKACTLTALVQDYLMARNNDPLRNPLDRRDENNTKQAFRFLVECYPLTLPSEIDGEALEKYQIFLVLKGYARTQCNRLVKFVKMVFNWAARYKHISEERAFSLRTVRDLLPSPAIKENKRRKPCPESYIDAILPFLRAVIADMLRLIVLHGMRPNEVCTIKASDIDFVYDGVNWLYMPEKHKTYRRGLERAVVLCKASQAILKPYLRLDEPDKTVFLNSRGNTFTARSFGRVIKIAIEKHKLPKFVLYQVRHMVGTKTAKRYGLEPTRALLGHTDTRMTRRYVDGDRDAIQQIANDRNEEKTE